MIDLLPSAEQQQMIDSVAAMLADIAPVASLLRESSPETREVWSKVAELGCFGLGLPETMGGFGGTIVEEVLVFREFGRFVLSPSYIATSLAAHIAALMGNAELAKRLVTADAKAAFAIPIEQGDVPSSGGSFFLIDPDGADFCLEVDDGQVVLRARDDFAITAQRQATDDFVAIDAAELSRDNPVAHHDDTNGLIRRKLLLLATAMMVGISEASRDMAADYAKIREQFGKPIGTFQAIKHSCANAALRTQAALCQTFYSARSEREQMSDAEFQVNAAFLVASDAARNNTTTNIQVHGGFGYTAECPAHLFLKRYNLLAQIAGPARMRHMALMAEAAPV